MGGPSPAAIRRTAHFAEGWRAGIESVEEVAPVVAAIKARARAAGRVIADDPELEARRAALRLPPYGVCL